MTIAEVFEKYGDVVVFFENYYKYTFNYRGICKNTGHVVLVSYGGDSDEIYRYEVSAGIGEPLRDFEDAYLTLEIRDPSDSTTIFQHYDYF